MLLVSPQEMLEVMSLFLSLYLIEWTTKAWVKYEMSVVIFLWRLQYLCGRSVLLFKIVSCLPSTVCFFFWNHTVASRLSGWVEGAVGEEILIFVGCEEQCVDFKSWGWLIRALRPLSFILFSKYLLCVLFRDRMTRNASYMTFGIGTNTQTPFV